jgi:hypothetical protein
MAARLRILPVLLGLVVHRRVCLPISPAIVAALAPPVRPVRPLRHATVDAGIAIARPLRDICRLALPTRDGRAHRSQCRLQRDRRDML